MIEWQLLLVEPGFGLAITERFIEAGAKVIIWDIDDNAAKEAIDKVKSENLTPVSYTHLRAHET